MTSRLLPRRSSSGLSISACYALAPITILMFSCMSSSLLGLSAQGEDYDPKSAELLILHRAGWFMPNSLKRVLDKHRQQLDSGFKTQVLRNPGCAQGRRLLEEGLRRRVLVLDRLLQSKPGFGDMAREFGAVARLVIYLNMPEGEHLSDQELDFVFRYIEKNNSYFPLVVYVDPAQGIDSMEAFLLSLRLRRVQLWERLRDAYPDGLALSSLESYDFRSPVFGVCSLVYSHSVNDIARLWLSVWKSANGDLSGRPIPGQ